jgi:hypothetical protein
MIEVGVNYSGIILNDYSKNKLLSRFSEVIPKNHNIMLNYIHICYGEMPLQLKNYVGLNVCVDASKYFFNKCCFVVGCDNTPFKIENPVILVSMNNTITDIKINELYGDWVYLNKPFRLSGTVAEVPYKII